MSTHNGVFKRVLRIICTARSHNFYNKLHDEKQKYHLNVDQAASCSVVARRRDDGRIATGGLESGVVMMNMGKHLRILLLTEVIIRVDRTGICTIERDQLCTG